MKQVDNNEFDSVGNDENKGKEVNIDINRNIEEEYDERLEEMEFIFKELDLNDENISDEDEFILYKDDLDDSYEAAFLTREEREEYAEENIKIIYAVAKNYIDENHSREELISVGYEGFTKALNNFDKNRNVKFSTYAWRCITYEILHYLRKENEHVNNRRSINQVLNVDESGNEMELGDILKDTDYGAKTNDETVILSEAVEMMNELIHTLPEHEQYILTHIYGLNGAEIKTQVEIAKAINMSQANVSKLGLTLLYKLKVLMGSKYKLRDLNDI